MLANLSAHSVTEHEDGTIHKTKADAMAAQAAWTHGLIVEPSWVPGENAQAAMRMDGPLQTEQITVQMVGVAGTIDEDIQRANAVKTRMQVELFS